MRSTRPTSSVRIASATLLVGLVAGLAAGATGTASAAGALSKGAVKKIATKVVDQKAASLSVRHAATADQATTAATLQGRTAADLGTAPTVYTIAPGGSFGQVGEWLLPPIAPGTYDFRFNASLVPNAFGSTLACGFRNPSAPANVFGLSQATHVSPFLAAWPVGTTVHTVASGEQVSFLCSTSGSTFTVGGTGITIEVTRLDGSTTVPLSPLPRPAPGSTPGLARN